MTMGRAAVVLLVIGILAGGAPARAQGPAPAVAVTSPGGAPFAAAEKAAISAMVLGHPLVAPALVGHDVHVVSVTAEEMDKTLVPAPGVAPARIASVVLFDYTLGSALRVRVNPATGALVSREQLAGHPPASADERKRAEAIIRTNVENDQLLRSGGILEGGFIVVDHPARLPLAPSAIPHRLIEFHILSPNRAELRRIVHVDLTAGTIASIVTK